MTGEYETRFLLKRDNFCLILNGVLKNTIAEHMVKN